VCHQRRNILVYLLIDLLAGQVYVGAAAIAGVDRASGGGVCDGSKTTLVLIRTLQKDADAQSRYDEIRCDTDLFIIKSYTRYS